ncbi:Virulence-associated protein E, putative [Magnetospirillum gryphiswaldense MSR-1 v2]|uniref:Virulence-associated protein E, putative n=2 Tax=Magnetospirillum gryphiswaldense TaxID=55518 RepID=V6F2S4_MAGGM|nr:Virulence-associated protein E, putative [Magnetospirillum gryphiswaldense MSR-1 v2]
MIDLNDVWQPPARFDLPEIRGRLAATALDWLPGLFPHGLLSPDRRTLRCADLAGRSPRKEGSCIIHLAGHHAGWGFDHATGESAGPIDLIHHATGLADRDLFEEAARLARLDLPAVARPVAAKPSHDLEIKRIIDGSISLAGTIGETYLKGRGIGNPRSPDLLYHDDLPDFEGRRGWPGLVGIVRDGAGNPVGGIHRTFLLDDGSDKAPPGKKMLGAIDSGSVRLAPVPADGDLGIAEGIETALSAWAIFGIPTWAALSAGGMRQWQWPEGTRRVSIFADAGDVGMQAAATLADRLNTAGIPSSIVVPLHGDDFNDDLRKGAVAAHYNSLPSAEDPPSLSNFDDLRSAALKLTYPPDMDEFSRLLGDLARARLEPAHEREVLVAIKAAARIPVATMEKHLTRLHRELRNGNGMPSVRPAWFAQIRTGADGNPERNEANVITALSHDEAFAGALIFDEFRQEIVVNRSLPWDDRISASRPWGEADDVRCAEWLQRRDINVSPKVVARSIGAVAHGVRIHPVREYLSNLTWDGIHRMETWAITYLGAADTRLNRAFGSLWMISAVARIMDPGTKVDHMLILEGPQGAKKSTALKTLAGAEWFTDELAEIGSKDAAQQTRGVWIIEIAELDAIGRAEVSRIKSFLSRSVDRYRPPYERYVTDVPRQCVFAGTVNPDTYLRDETGNRRFWPIRCGKIDLEAIRRARDQLWAEAMAMYSQGAIWWLDDPDLIAQARAEQEERYQSDAWDGLIDRWLVYDKQRVNRGYAAYDDWREEEVERAALLTDVSVAEILQNAIGIEPGRWTRGDQMRISAYLKARGWERYRSRSGASLDWRYRSEG